MSKRRELTLREEDEADALRRLEEREQRDASPVSRAELIEALLVVSRQFSEGPEYYSAIFDAFRALVKELE